MPFSDFHLSKGLQGALADLGCLEPFPVQSAVIPRALEGRDLSVRAATGSGKTLAFALPLVELLERDAFRGVSGRTAEGRDSGRKPFGAGIISLVLVPTRELAIQVGSVFRDLLHGAGSALALRVVHGGPSINPDMLALRGGADILVATPGRLLDLAARNAARLGSVRRLVLDEADRILDLGFREELAAILALLPADRQTLLFSATLEGETGDIARSALRSGEVVDIGAAPPPRPAGSSSVASSGPSTLAPGPEENSGIIEKVYRVAREEKGPFLRRLIEDSADFDRILVFASSTRRADNVTRKLLNNGVAAAAFHGDLSQAARVAALEAFRKGRVRILVASDLASRGLDIAGMPCVINYELPRQPLDYVHRIGRTGRAGAPGLAITLVSPDEEEQLRLIEKRIGRHLASFPKPEFGG